MKGISAFISMAFVILFGIIAMSVVLVVVAPTLDRAKDFAVVDEAMQSLEILDNNVREMASEYKEAKRTISVSVTDGSFKVDTGHDFLYFIYTPKTALGISGSRGDVEIETGDNVFSDYFVKYDEASDASPTWTTVAGTWQVQSGKFNVINGTAYHPVTLKKGNYYKLSANVTNVSGETGGEIAVLPGAVEDLKLWLHFDEGSGSNMTYDYSGNKNNGTLTNMNIAGNSTSGWNSTDCKYGNCLKFDGINDYVDCGNSESLQITSAITVSVWVKVKNEGSYDAIVAKSDGNTAGWVLSARGDDDTWSFWVYVGSFYRGQMAKTWQDGNWHHVVGTYDGETVTIYVDGVEGTEDTTPSGDITDYNGNVMIGQESDGGVFFDGTLDEVKIYSRALSGDEVSADYTLGLKRLTGTDSITFTAPQADINLTLSNPGGTSDFDDIILSGGDQNQLRFVVPYGNIEIQGSDHFSSGQNQIIIKHNGTNATNSRPNIAISK